MNLEQKIEALLFYKNEPLKIKKVAKILEASEEETKEALKKLAQNLESRGIVLLENDDEVCLATAPGAKNFLEEVAKEEMRSEIGRAGLETLAIILYNDGATRREIDYIRGVNSAFILRHLAIRGLIQKEPDPKNQRIPRYRGTLELLAHLGIKDAKELPDFETFSKKVSEINENKETENEE